MAQLNRGPNIYIDEVPSDVHTVTGVATSIAAFVDFFARGPMDEAVRVLDIGAFNKIYGGLNARSEASYGIAQYFANGGSQAWIVRTASGPWAPASIAIRDAPAGATVLTVTAIHPGLWGNDLRITIDPVSNTNFNMSVQLFEMRGGRRIETQSESFRDLSMNAGPRFADSVVNDEFTGSTLVRVAAVAGAAVPQAVGTLSGPIPAPLALTVANDAAVDVTIGIEGTGTATMTGAAPTTIAQARARLESAIRAVHPELPAFAQARVSIIGDRLRVQAGPTTDPAAQVTFAPSGVDTTAADLMLTPAVALQGVLSGDLAGLVFPAGGIPAGGQVRATIGAGAPQVITLGNMNTLADVRDQLELALRAAAGAAPEFANARVALHTELGASRLIIAPDAAGAQIVFAQEGVDTTFGDLALDPAAAANPATDVIVTRTGDLPAPAPAVAAGSRVLVTIGGLQRTATLGGAATFPNVRTQLENAIRGVPGATPPFTGARVAYYDNAENRYLVIAGGAPAAVLFAPAPLDATTVAELRLDAAAAPNVQTYALGGPAAGVAGTAQGPGVRGNDGVPPDGNALRGDPNLHTGLYALDNVDLFNILCIPRTATDIAPLPDAEATAVIAEGRNYCERRRAFFIVDTPAGIDTVDEIQAWMGMPQHAGLRHRNLAIYFPRVQVPDPLNEFRLRSFGASGTMAGVFSRIDGTRGVWKAPAGLEATLDNVQRLDYRMTDSECGVLNPLGINCLRTFPVSGNIAWGARTLVGADVPDSEWKYVSIRRLALFLEETLFRNTTWIIFEPNDEPLWAKIRLNLNAFMMGLFRQGAFQGSTPDKAFFVKCDAETTTQADRNLGVVNIDVGFCPLKPCEFVVIRIQQMRGDLA